MVAFRRKGTVQLVKGNYREAIPFFDKSLKIEPDNPRILANKRLALEKISEMNNAENK